MIDQGLLEEPDPRTVGPYAAVIAEYKRHGDKAVRRHRTAAALYYFAVAIFLEKL